MQFRVQGIQNQDEALRALAELIRKGQEHPRVRATALKIVGSCPSRDELCELQSIYDAVKNGSPEARALANGFPYRADPKSVDFFTSADRLLAMCEKGACGGDCDEHTVLCASLAGSLGFTVGARVYGPSKSPSGEFVHVYAVAIAPKKSSNPRDPKAKVIAMDTTVPSANLGWQPPPGHYKTAWVQNG